MLPGTLSLWRRRRNPLLRRSDVAESWLVVVTTLLVLLGAPAAGALTSLNTVADAQGPEVRDVPAVVVKHANGGPDDPYGIGLTRVHATVRWTDDDGTRHTGVTLVPVSAKAGERTDVHLDKNGALVRNPVDRAQVTAEAIVLGTAAATGTGLVAYGAGRTGRLLIERHRQTQWGRDWAAVEPYWTGRTGTGA